MTRALLFAGVLLLSAFSLQALSSQAELQNSIVLNEVGCREVWTTHAHMETHSRFLKQSWKEDATKLLTMAKKPSSAGFSVGLRQA
jgi:hypothetical protein